MVFLADCGVLQARKPSHVKWRIMGSQAYKKVEKTDEAPAEGDKHFRKKYEVYPDKVEREVKIVRTKKGKKRNGKKTSSEKPKASKKKKKKKKTLLD